MYYITIKGHFSSAHNLREYKGKCEDLHGHNWKVDVVLKGGKLDKTGMLVDFKEAKKWMNKVLGRLDHTYLNETPPFDQTNPTSENIAHYIFQEMKLKVKTYKNVPVAVHKIMVWENENSAATYEE